jgi:hypothetical protein
MTDLRDLRRRRSATWPFGISLDLLLVKGDGQASVATSRHVHILMMSDALTEGIVKQFRREVRGPQKGMVTNSGSA